MLLSLSFICLSFFVYLSLSLFVFIFICLCFYVFVFICLYLYISLSVFTFISLYFYLPLSLFVFIFLCLYSSQNLSIETQSAFILRVDESILRPPAPGTRPGREPRVRCRSFASAPNRPLRSRWCSTWRSSCRARSRSCRTTDCSR